MPHAGILAPAVALGLAAAAPAAGATAAIRYGLVPAHPATLPLLVGKDRGCFEQHGVALDLALTGTTAAATQALIGGSVDSIGPTGDASFAAQLKEPRLKHVMASGEGVMDSLLAVPEIGSAQALRASGQSRQAFTRKPPPCPASRLPSRPT
jgi:ABC-type nitrate/sulfonate/bicarbonate transport system substrate-binding protein